MSTEEIFGYIMIGFALVMGGLLIYYFGFRLREKEMVNTPSQWNDTSEKLSGYVDEAVQRVTRAKQGSASAYSTSTPSKE